MNLKSILFGTAAGLMVATGAYAADLPGDAAPAAVDYVKVCDAYGAGFFYIPGTETCLRVKGRVRASATYTNEGGNRNSNKDNVVFKADAKVGFDARTASDLGTVRSYFEIETADSNKAITVAQAFIQVGYVTVGRHDDPANSDFLYGINDTSWTPGDYTATGASVMFDKLGGGFFVGAGVYSGDNNNAKTTVWTSGTQADLHISGIAGITGQSWGGIDVSGVYDSSDKDGNDVFGVKATANLKLIDKLSLRSAVAYTDFGNNGATNDFGLKDTITSAIDLSLAAAYQVTDPLSIYAGVRYRIVDAAAASLADNTIYGNIGADYQLATGLNLQGEVDYLSTNGADQFKAVTRLVRVW